MALFWDLLALPCANMESLRQGERQRSPHKEYSTELIKGDTTEVELEWRWVAEWRATESGKCSHVKAA